MRIRLLVSVKDGDGWHNPGTILDRDDDEARRLILQKAAEVVEEKIVTEDDEEVSEGDLQKMAVELVEIDGVNDDLAYRLIEAGYGSVQSVAEAEPEDLIEIKGIGRTSVKKIQESASDIIDGSKDEENEED